MSKVTDTGSGVRTGVSGARLGFFLCLLSGHVCIPLGQESSASNAALDRSTMSQQLEMSQEEKCHNGRKCHRNKLPQRCTECQV